MKDENGYIKVLILWLFAIPVGLISTGVHLAGLLNYTR